MESAFTTTGRPYCLPSIWQYGIFLIHSQVFPQFGILSRFQGTILLASASSFSTPPWIPPISKSYAAFPLTKLAMIGPVSFPLSVNDTLIPTSFSSCFHFPPISIVPLAQNRISLELSRQLDMPPMPTPNPVNPRSRINSLRERFES